MSANRATPHKGTFDGTVKSDAQMWSRTRAGTVDRKVAARTSLTEKSGLLPYELVAAATFADHAAALEHVLSVHFGEGE